MRSIFELKSPAIVERVGLTAAWTAFAIALDKALECTDDIAGSDRLEVLAFFNDTPHAQRIESAVGPLEITVHIVRWRCDQKMVTAQTVVRIYRSNVWGIIGYSEDWRRFEGSLDHVLSRLANETVRNIAPQTARV